MNWMEIDKEIACDNNKQANGVLSIFDILLSHSISFDWCILMHNTFKQSSPVIMLIVYAGENITDMPSRIDKFLIKQMN